MLISKKVLYLGFVSIGFMNGFVVAAQTVQNYPALTCNDDLYNTISNLENTIKANSSNSDLINKSITFARKIGNYYMGGTQFGDGGCQNTANGLNVEISYLNKILFWQTQTQPLSDEQIYSNMNDAYQAALMSVLPLAQKMPSMKEIDQQRVPAKE